jgi:hypothetical protein
MSPTEKKDDSPAPPSATNVTVTLKGIGTLEGLTSDLAAFVTATSSTANAMIDSASAELARRIAKQIEEIERERDAVSSLPPST